MNRRGDASTTNSDSTSAVTSPGSPAERMEKEREGERGVGEKGDWGISAPLCLVCGEIFATQPQLERHQRECTLKLFAESGQVCIQKILLKYVYVC
jgi:hypothetical protein